MKLLFRTLRTRPTSVTPASLLTHRGSAVNPLTIATKVQRPFHCQTMSGCLGCSACSSVATFFLNLESTPTSYEAYPIPPCCGRVVGQLWHTIVPHVQVQATQGSPSLPSLLLRLLCRALTGSVSVFYRAESPWQCIAYLFRVCKCYSIVSQYTS